MHAQPDKAQELIGIALGAGLAAGLLYPIGLLDLLPARYNAAAFMLFGPCFAVAAYGMRAFYARSRDSATNDVGHLLLVLAGLSFSHMATMQMSIYALVPRYHRSSLAPDAATWDAILRGVSSTQLGLDFAFDLFVSSGAALLGWQMVRHPKVPSLLGWAGIAIGGGGLLVNTIAFPLNPEEVGLFDPAPLFGVWFAVAWLPILRFRKWRGVDVVSSCTVGE